MVDDKSLTGRAVVIGAGVMGTGIAAVLANVGWEVDLLDRVPDTAVPGHSGRSRLAAEGLERALAARPPLFSLPEYAARVRIGNFEDDLDRAAGADWVVEAVAEDLPTKSAVHRALAEHIGSRTVVSSSTSGLSLAAMSAGCPTDYRRRFLGTHFFNPPRYMVPVELIPTAETDPAVFEAFARFADRVLGKRVIRAKDTPGFVSTRLGMYALSKAVQTAFERQLSVEQADYLTGPLIGRPRSGTFRLADVIGLDIVVRIADNLVAALPNDAAYRALRLPDAVRTLVQDGRTGWKAGAGFYKREADGSLLALDLRSLDYRELREPERYPSDVEGLPLAERLQRIWEISPQQDGGFLRDALRAGIGYVADVTPDVSERIVEVDDALTGGFGWEMGPFHTLDALGTVEWPGGEPALVTRLAEAGETRFYRHVEGRHLYFDLQSGRMQSLPRPPDVIVLKDLVRAGRVVSEAGDAALLDIGEGAACVWWRTRVGALSPEVVGFIDSARERCERDFAALVIAGGGVPFSVGYDLKLLAARIEARDWVGIDLLLAAFQRAVVGLQRAGVPSVCAVSGYALGGGCEIALRSAGVQAAFESYVGLPEANVGLVPAGGGLAAMLRRVSKATELSGSVAAVEPVWRNLAHSRYSSSADEARCLRYLSNDDSVTRHPDRLLYDARERALALARSRTPPAEAARLHVCGDPGLTHFRAEIDRERSLGQMSEHDARVAERLAWVLCGGERAHPGTVEESYVLDLEREALLSLAGTPQTLARIRHMLSTGKPLRN